MTREVKGQIANALAHVMTTWGCVAETPRDVGRRPCMKDACFGVMCGRKRQRVCKSKFLIGTNLYPLLTLLKAIALGFHLHCMYCLTLL